LQKSFNDPSFVNDEHQYVWPDKISFQDEECPAFGKYNVVLEKKSRESMNNI